MKKLNQYLIVDTEFGSVQTIEADSPKGAVKRLRRALPVGKSQARYVVARFQHPISVYCDEDFETKKEEVSSNGDGEEPEDGAGHTQDAG